MSPQKQAAQTANAQKSHSATTEAGRARSSQNSIRHSLCSKKYLIVPEERPEFDLYYKDLIEALAPEGAVEALLAEAIILDSWRMTRARLVENQIFCRGYMSAKIEDQFVAGAETWLANSKELATLTLYEQRINRVLTRNKAEFESRQAVRGRVAHPCVPDVSVSAPPPTPMQSPDAPPLAAQPTEPKPETAAPQSSSEPVRSTADPTVGFVRSSADSSGGFVRSNVPVAGLEAPLARPAEPGAEPQPASTPPASARRAA
jgi:hypothetical protein